MASDFNWAKADPNAAYFITLQAGRCGKVEGPPGVAKTQYHIQLAKKTGRDLILLLGSTMAPEDVGGIPHIALNEQFFRQLPPWWANRLQDPNCLVFVDEFTTVTPSVRAPMLTMFSDRRVGQCHIHPDNWMAAACNPPQWAPNASPLEKAMANRFSHYTWKENFDGFVQGLESGQANDFGMGDIPVLPEHWKGGMQKWGYTIAGYLRKNSNDRVSIPESDDDMAYPTYRTWHSLRDCLAAAESVSAPANIIHDIAHATVGRAAAGNFLQYIDAMDLVDPEEVLSGRMEFIFDKRRVDLAAVLMSTVVACIRRDYSEDRMVAAISLFCENIGKHAKDLVFTQLRNLVEARPAAVICLPKAAMKIMSDFGNTISPEVRARLKK